MNGMEYLNALLPFVLLWLIRIDRRVVRIETKIECMTGSRCEDKNKQKGDEEI